jgi:hypothetical protein
MPCYQFSDSELVAARARNAQKEAEKAAPAPAPGFTYSERSPQQWNRRITQSLRSSFGVAVEAAPEIEDGDEDTDGGEPKSKVSSTTLCVCGHARKDHHTTPEAHTVDGEAAYYCITAHCSVMRYENGQQLDCDCQHFRAQETDVPKLTRARVGDYDLCAGCHHWKVSHCTKAKPGKANRLKAGELAYRILRAPDGTGYGCKHVDPANSSCQCTSSSCSYTSDGVNLCECEKFVNPWLTPKTRAAAKPRAPRKLRKKKTVFTTGPQELFPRSAQLTDVHQ